MPKKILTITFLLLCIFAIGAPWLNTLDNKKPRPPIRISVSPSTSFELLHLAEIKGFFKEEAVSVKLVRLSVLEDARRSYVRGQVDGMTGSLAEMIKARENGRESRILFVMDFSNDADVIIDRKDINSLADLKCKKIAVEPESFGLSIINAAIGKSGPSYNDINLKEVSQLNIPHAVLTGEIDAAHTYTPYLIPTLKNNANISVLIDSSQTKGEIVDVLALDPQIIEQRPEDMKAIKRAWDRALAYAQTHPKEAYLLMSEIENISQQDFANNLKKSRMFNSSETDNLLKPNGVVEESLIKVYSILHRENPHLEAIRISDYILPNNESLGQKL